MGCRMWSYHRALGDCLKRYGRFALRPPAASAAAMPQGAAFCGDRGGQIKRGPRKTCFAGKSSTFHRRKVDRKAAGGPLHQGRNAPRNPPFADAEDAEQKTLSQPLGSL